MQDIEIYIDEIVLHGFARNDYAGIKTAIQAELERLLGERGIPSTLSAGGNYRQIELGEFNMTKGANPAKVGNNIAGSVYNGLKNLKVPSKK